MPNIKEIKKCCDDILDIRKLIINSGDDHSRVLQYSSDLLIVYHNLIELSNEEIKFLKSVQAIK